MTKILAAAIQKYPPFFRTEDALLFNNDCLELLQFIPGNSIDMIFADPPYKLSSNGVTCQSGKMAAVNKGTWDKSNGFDADTSFHNEWISATYHSIYQCGYLLQKNKFHILNDIAWFKMIFYSIRFAAAARQEPHADLQAKGCLLA